MKRTKLLIAITCAMAASLAFSASAFNGGDGTASHPYEIATVADLEELAELSVTDSLDGKHFVQTADILLDETSICISQNSALPFMGSYNGMNYEISGLSFASADVTAENGLTTSASGLFLFAKDAEIINVDITDALLEVSNVSGGIVAKAYGETVIQNCTFTGTAVMPEGRLMSSNVGAIAGILDSDAKITDCESYFTFNISASPLMIFAGGLAGLNNGSIEESVANVNFSAVSDNYSACFGGIVGENTGSVAGCVSNGEISGEITNDVALLYIGGIVGYNNGGTVERTLNKALLNSVGYSTYPGYIGGICGYNSNGSVSVSANNGSVAGDVSFAGGVAGINYATDGTASVSECLNSGEVSVLTGYIGGLVGGNLASDDSANVSAVTSSLNTYELENGNAAIGCVNTDLKGVSSIKNLIVRNLTDSYASTMTDAELTAANAIDALTSDAWVYPQNGFLPSLAVVKNLAKTEVIATAIDKENEKAAFTLYNPEALQNAVAVLSFKNSGRLIGTKFVDFSATNGYSVHTVDTAYAAEATEVSIMVINNLTGFKPVSKPASY